jgi:hypothetical protein
MTNNIMADNNNAVFIIPLILITIVEKKITAGLELPYQTELACFDGPPIAVNK